MATKKAPAKKGSAKKTSSAKSTPSAARREELAEDVSESRRSSGMAKESADAPEFQPPPNDNLTNLFLGSGLVPKKYQGSDNFLDIVTWNIRFFHDQDPDRVKRIVSVLSELNADVIVMQEIKNQSLEVVAEELRIRDAGFYQTAYGTTGGDQRVAVMYDLDWIRAKDDIRELFGKGQIKVGNKDAFPRLPLYGYFTGLAATDPFDFQLVGLHLKSQRGGGGDQRQRSAAALRDWLVDEATAEDSDVIMLGDWNEVPTADTWRPFHDLEENELVKFSSINNESQISHLMYKNKKEIGSRLDLSVVSMTASERMGEPPDVVKWAPLEDFLGTDPKAQQIKEFLRQIREEVSDHMPVVTRFYFTDKDE
jgi:endonuclease/exonuclease/phosphatase family metal-dependent hydrolase